MAIRDGQYETFGQVGGMSIAYLGAVNDAGDVVGTAKDAQITTEDECSSTSWMEARST